MMRVLVGKDRNAGASTGSSSFELSHGGHVGKVDSGRVIDGLLGTRGVELASGVCKGTAVDSSHGDAKGTGLKEVMVGETFNELHLLVIYTNHVV